MGFMSFLVGFFGLPAGFPSLPAYLKVCVLVVVLLSETGWLGRSYVGPQREEELQRNLLK